MALSFFGQLLIWLVPGIPAIILHEVAHGWVASKMGDPTARDAGRLSLNPLRHIDPVGTVIIPGLMLLAHLPFVFGWARPVPVNFLRLRNVRVGTLLVSLAGPLTNILMMLGWLALLWVVVLSQGSNVSIRPGVMLLAQMALSGVIVNVALTILNLMPIPPLDGGRIVGALLPDFLSKPYMRLERFGILILLLLIVTGIFNRVFSVLLQYAINHLGIALS